MNGLTTSPGVKDGRIIKKVGWLFLIIFLLIPANLFGQESSLSRISDKARVSASASSAHQFKSNIDGGGGVSITHYGVGVGGAMPLTDRLGLRTHLSYDREEYNFSDSNAFLITDPWSQVDRIGLSMRLRYTLTHKWNINAGPVVQYAGETGAQLDDSLMYGGIITAVYRINTEFSIGFGAGVFSRFHETKIFPSLIVYWEITDRLRLGNGSTLGLLGPASLELSYKFADHWEAAIGGGYRSSRFRLDQNGPTRGGIGENRSWPVYARITGKLGSVIHIDLYGGADFSGEMKLQDANGNDIRSLDYNTAPILGLNLRASI
ncbi:MAG: hypothetical protein JW884_01930 [Deltaproteobacteria bacterium]|nr:hypothetical protein [Deltaproteobacteria bacterium]